MRIIVLLTVCSAAMGLATAVAAQQVDHSTHHPAETNKPAAAPAKQAPAKPGAGAMPDETPCAVMMSKKTDAGSQAMPMMTAEQRQHCMQMMGRAATVHPAGAPAK